LESEKRTKKSPKEKNKGGGNRTRHRERGDQRAARCPDSYNSKKCPRGGPAGRSKGRKSFLGNNPGRARKAYSPVKKKKTSKKTLPQEGDAAKTFNEEKGSAKIIVLGGKAPEQ